VRHLIEQGTAQCILGNHELNLMRGDHKHGNGWYYGESEVIRKDKGAISFQIHAPDDAFRSEVRAFFDTLPLALVRDDTVVVHAAWQAESVAKLKDLPEGVGVVEAFELFEAATAAQIKEEGIEDKEVIDLMEQNNNPIKVLSSGLEGKAAEPFFAGGKMRTLERVKWWETYAPAAGEEDRLVIIGHFWRRFMDEVDGRVEEKHPEGPFLPTGADMFPGYRPSDLLGPRKKVMCVDYAAGVRFEERGMELPEGTLGTQLAALRLPERTLHLSDSRVLKCE